MPIIGLWLGSGLGCVLLLDIYGWRGGLGSHERIRVIKGWIKRRHVAKCTKAEARTEPWSYSSTISQMAMIMSSPMMPLPITMSVFIVVRSFILIFPSIVIFPCIVKPSIVPIKRPYRATRNQPQQASCKAYKV